MYPREIKEFLTNSECECIDIGCSGAKVTKILKDNKEFFLKESVAGLLDKEYLALNWLNGKINVPKVVYFATYQNKSFMLTEKLQGEMLCCDALWDYPEQIVKLAADAINLLQTIDYTSCPLDSDLDHKLATAKYNIDNNLLDPENDSHYFKKFGSYDEIYKFLVNNKPKEEFCFSHGDTSLPNIFQKDGRVSGFLDVGECGRADKWFDIAITVKSIRRNFEDEKYVNMFFERLGIAQNKEKVEYYILLMELYL